MRMQKMPVPGKITDKMKKQPMPNRPMPKGAEPKRAKGTQLNKLKQAYGNVLGAMQKAGPAGPRNKKQAYGSALEGLKKAGPKQKPGKLGKPRVTRPVQPPRRGSR